MSCKMVASCFTFKADAAFCCSIIFNSSRISPSTCSIQPHSRLYRRPMLRTCLLIKTLRYDGGKGILSEKHRTWAKCRALWRASACAVLAAFSAARPLAFSICKKNGALRLVSAVAHCAEGDSYVCACIAGWPSGSNWQHVHAIGAAAGKPGCAQTQCGNVRDSKELQSHHRAMGGLSVCSECRHVPEHCSDLVCHLLVYSRRAHESHVVMTVPLAFLAGAAAAPQAAVPCLPCPSAL